MTNPLQIPDAAQQMLNTWDQFINGEPCSDMVKADVDLLIKAACFAAQAYEDMIASPITADAAPGTLLRIFLTAIVDPASKELDPYRAKNRPDATLTNDGAKPVDVTAVLNSAALIVEGRSTAINSNLITSIYSAFNGYEIAEIIANHDKELGAAIRALSAEPAQGARPLEEWHEDHGNVVWWAWDNDRQAWLGEPAYIGKPLDSDWPEYHTHWTPHPAFPAAPTPEAVE